MVLFFVLHVSCSLHGLDGRECLAVGWVETAGTWRDATSSTGCVGPMQVQPAFSSTPAWLLATTPGNALAGAAALAYWHRHRGNAWARGYACGWKDGSKRCARYERAVQQVLARIKPRRVT